MRKYFALLFMLLIAASVKADYINDGRHQYYGKITSLSSTSVKIRIGCTGEVKSFGWNEIVGLIFDTQCTHDGPEFSSSPVTAELNCPKKTVFTIKFKGLSDVSYAERVELDNNRLTVQFANNRGNYAVTEDHLENKIEWMMQEEKCTSDLNNPFPIPSR